MTPTPPPMPEPAWSTMIVKNYQGHYYNAEQIKARDAQWMERIQKLEAENAMLREALQGLVKDPGIDYIRSSLWDAARAALESKT